MNHKTVVAAVLTLSVGATESFATSYNDVYWNSLNSNTDFVDQFATTSLDRNKWLVEQNIFVNGEDQDYQDVEFPAADWTVASGQPDASALDGKVLNLKARYMDGVVQDYYGGIPFAGKPLFIRAGRIESQITDTSTFVYGKFEARIKMPPAINAEFPAWWLLGNFPDVGWTACQELDIIEFTGRNASVAPQTHWSAPYPIYGGNPSNTTYASLGINPSNEYVTYGVIKTPDSAAFYINGVNTYTFSRENQGEEQPWPYVTPMRMILNHAITHVEWPDVGNYNKFSTDSGVANRTGYNRVTNGVTEYEYIDTGSMATNIGRAGTDFLVDYVAHWPLPSSDPLQKYVDESKYSIFRTSNNTKGFYSLRGWLAPVSVTGDAYLQEGGSAERDNGIKNAADGYVGSKWATPKDDNFHSVQFDYGMDKLIKYFWIEWAWNLPASYDIYGKASGGNWELIRSSTQTVVGWTTHVFDVNQSYRYIKLVTKGRIAKSEPIWLLEFKAFEDVVDVYPKPQGSMLIDRAVNMLSNGNFSTNLDGWNGENYDGTNATYAAVSGEARITATAQGANSGSYQLHTQGFGLRKDYRYEVSFKARAAAARNMMVRLSEDQLNPVKIQLLQTVALGASMADYSFTLDYTDADNAGRLSFLFGGMGSDTVYIDNVVIKELAFIGTANNYVTAITAENFVAASAGWEWQWWGAAARAVDGATGNKASSTTGNEGLDMWVTVKIDPEYEIKQVLVAGDKSAPRSLAHFKVEYGADNTTMIDWTASNLDGSYETFTQFTQSPPANTRDFKIWFRPVAGQLVEVADVQFMAVDLKPYRISSIVLEGAGTVSPAGVTRYSLNNTDTATYTFTPPPGGSVADVMVDGISVGAVLSYTFTAISQSHDLAVSFSAAPVASSSAGATSSVASVSASSIAASSVASVPASSVAASSVASVPASSIAASSIASVPASSIAASSVVSAPSSSTPASSLASVSISSVTSVVTSSARPASMSSAASSLAGEVGGTPISSASSRSETASSNAASSVATTSSSATTQSSESASSTPEVVVVGNPPPPKKSGGGAMSWGDLWILGILSLLYFRFSQSRVPNARRH